MSSSEVIGDLADLHVQSFVVPAAHPGSGNSASGSFKLSENADLKHYIDNHASVRITGDIVFEVSGPVSSTIATAAIVALYPDKYTNGPTTRNHVERLEGRVSLQSSLLVGSVRGTPRPGREVGDSLKVKTLVDYPPVVAYHVDIAGGTNASTWTITAHVPISVDGVPHRKTW